MATFPDPIRSVSRVRVFPGVLWQLILLAILLTYSEVSAQVDSVKSDTLKRITFGNGGVIAPEPVKARRTLDAVLSVGAGYWDQGTTSVFEPMANLDFYAQTSILNFTAGFHAGLSKPSPKSLSVGLRLPIVAFRETPNPVYADASLLFIDNGADSNAFSTGLRFALAGRLNRASIEYRLAGELRRFPFGGEHFEAWGGVELGVFINLLQEDIREVSRKDTIRAELRFISTSEEAKTLEDASSDQQLEDWLTKFWAARETIANAPRNAARNEYMRRVAIANRDFSSARRMGVETDQGRVLLLYGDPDRIENAPSSYDPTTRYLLWIYEDRIRGYKSAMFLFRNSIGNNSANIFASHGVYQQVFSNIIGETSDGIPADLPVAMRNYIGSFAR